jgi:hypothetical protein
MCHQWTEVNDPIFIKMDSVKVWNSGYIDEGIDSSSNPALDLKNQICSASDDSGART